MSGESCQQSHGLTIFNKRLVSSTPEPISFHDDHEKEPGHFAPDFSNHSGRCQNINHALLSEPHRQFMRQNHETALSKDIKKRAFLPIESAPAIIKANDGQLFTHSFINSPASIVDQTAGSRCCNLSSNAALDAQRGMLRIRNCESSTVCMSFPLTEPFMVNQRKICNGDIEGNINQHHESFKNRVSNMSPEHFLNHNNEDIDTKVQSSCSDGLIHDPCNPNKPFGAMSFQAYSADVLQPVFSTADLPHLLAADALRITASASLQCSDRHLSAECNTASVKYADVNQNMRSDLLEMCDRGSCQQCEVCDMTGCTRESEHYELPVDYEHRRMDKDSLIVPSSNCSSVLHRYQPINKSRELRSLVNKLKDICYMNGVNEGCVVVQKLMRLIEMIPELRPGFNLQASIAEMLQAERTESSNLRRQIRSINSQLKEKELNPHEVSDTKIYSEILAQQLENVALTKKNKELEGSVDDLRHTVDKLQKEVKDVDNRLNSKERQLWEERQDHLQHANRITLDLEKERRGGNSLREKLCASDSQCTVLNLTRRHLDMEVIRLQDTLGKVKQAVSEMLQHWSSVSHSPEQPASNYPSMYWYRVLLSWITPGSLPLISPPYTTAVPRSQNNTKLCKSARDCNVDNVTKHLLSELPKVVSGPPRFTAVKGDDSNISRQQPKSMDLKQTNRPACLDSRICSVFNGSQRTVVTGTGSLSTGCLLGGHKERLDTMKAPAKNGTKISTLNDDHEGYSPPIVTRPCSQTTTDEHNNIHAGIDHKSHEPWLAGTPEAKHYGTISKGTKISTLNNDHEGYSRPIVTRPYSLTTTDEHNNFHAGIDHKSHEPWLAGTPEAKHYGTVSKGERPSCNQPVNKSRTVRNTDVEEEDGGGADARSVSTLSEFPLSDGDRSESERESSIEAVDVDGNTCSGISHRCPVNGSAVEKCPLYILTTVTVDEVEADNPSSSSPTRCLATLDATGTSQKDRFHTTELDSSLSTILEEEFSTATCNSTSTITCNSTSTALSLDDSQFREKVNALDDGIDKVKESLLALKRTFS